MKKETGKKSTRSKKSNVRVETRKTARGVAVDVSFDFPGRGIAVKAKNLSQAQKIANQRSTN